MPSGVMLTTLLAALALGGCGGGTEVVKTVTVERAAPAGSTPPEKPSEGRNARRPKERAQAKPVAPAPPSGYSHCDSNIEIKTATTTCAFAQNTFWHYWSSARASQLHVYSPAAATTFAAWCAVSSSLSVRCTTSDGGEVRFPQAAVDRYSQSQANAYGATHDLGPDPSEPLPLPDAAPSAPEPESPYNPGGNIPNYENGRGYRVQCADGMYSRSGGIQGACSGHGGVL
jgi:hypothetical protein